MKTFVSLLVLLLGAPVFAVPVSLSVVDGKDAPVAGAQVQLQSFARAPKGTTATSTNELGIATFEVEPSQGEADFVGRVAVWKDEFALGGGNLMLHAPLRVELKPSQAVSGTLFDEAHHPVAGAKVRFSFYRSSTAGRGKAVYAFEGPILTRMETVSGADGSWRIDHIPPDVSVGVSIRGTGWADASAQIPSGSSLATTLHRGAQINGRLLGLDEKPLAGVRVYAQQQRREFGSRAFGEATTGDDGAFELSGLDKGTYKVGFDVRDDAPFVVATIKDVSASPEKAVALPDARAVEGTLIGGQVVARDTKVPVAGAGISLHGASDPDSWNSATTDKTGRWQMRTLEKEGKLTVNNAPSGFVRDADLAQRAVSIGEAGHLDFNFDLPRASVFSGRFVDENGRGVRTSSLVIGQNNEEYPLKSDNTGAFETFGPASGEVEISRSMWGGDESEAAKWDVVGTKKFSVPLAKPLEIRLKRAEISTLEMGVFDQNDAAIEGAKVVVTLSTWNGQTGTSSPRELVSDKTGRVHLEGIRADESMEIQSAAKEGFDLAPLPKVEKQNGVYRADITLRKRGGGANGEIVDARGAFASGASVSGSGIETVSDEAGHFSLAPLPAGKTEIFAWKDDSFALASSDDKKLELKTQSLEPTDTKRAGELLESLKAETKNTNYWNRDALGNDVPGGDFETGAAKAQTAGARGIYRLIARFGSDPNIAPEKWIPVLQNGKSASDRLYNAGMWNSKAASVPASDAMRAYLAALEKDATEVEKSNDASNKWQNAIGLFGVAALAERMGENARADALFEHANAFVLKNFPEKGDKNTQSQDDIVGVMGEMVAVSPRLLAKLVALVDSDSPAYSRLLQDGAPLVARLAGLNAARPFLDQLKAAPKSRPDSNGHSANLEWAVAQGITNSIIAGGKSNPQLALELARTVPKTDSLGSDDWRARALSEAAFFQSADVAQGLWRESLPALQAGSAMRLVVRISERDEPLARSFYEKARLLLEEQSQDEANPMAYHPPSQAAAFAFYEARFAPARARYRLEKAFQKARSGTNASYDLWQYPRAMAVFDANRAWQWAQQIGNDDNSFVGFEVKRRIVAWLGQDEAKRRKANFGDRSGRDDDEF